MSDATIDRATFEELQDAAGADFVKDLVQTFLEEAPAMLKALREAIASENADAFRRAAHSLKSNANTFGAMTLGRLARELELGGLAPVRNAAGAPIDAAASEYARASKALEELTRG